MNVNDLTRQIIGFAFKIHNTLGFGFLESVYENAMRLELSRIGVEALQQEDLDVFYDGQRVGHFTPDLWIRDLLIIEVKSVQSLSKAHEVQLVNYLTATHVDNGLLINFGPSVDVKRKFREFKPKLLGTRC
ncbi:MAG TPA: GxxExxY protein [Pyrinomonadaceae bacterium]|nr:GxxExxY protein [Pyrinomonadaceae bacterium]